LSPSKLVNISRKCQPGNKTIQVENNGSSSWEVEDSENSEDEEAKRYKRNANMVKKRIKGREDICEVLVQVGQQVPKLHFVDDLDAGNETPYFD
jgi:hypothetical protein